MPLHNAQWDWALKTHPYGSRLGWCWSVVRRGRNGGGIPQTVTEGGTRRLPAESPPPHPRVWVSKRGHLCWRTLDAHPTSPHQTGRSKAAAKGSDTRCFEGSSSKAHGHVFGRLNVAPVGATDCPSGHSCFPQGATRQNTGVRVWCEKCADGWTGFARSSRARSWLRWEMIETANDFRATTGPCGHTMRARVWVFTLSLMEDPVVEKKSSGKRITDPRFERSQRRASPYATLVEPTGSGRRERRSRDATLRTVGGVRHCSESTCCHWYLRDARKGEVQRPKRAYAMQTLPALWTPRGTAAMYLVVETPAHLGSASPQSSSLNAAAADVTAVL
jgi:hypothetical protein